MAFSHVEEQCQLFGLCVREVKSGGAQLLPHLLVCLPKQLKEELEKESAW